LRKNKMSEHHSPIKTPKQLVIAIVACFLIPIIVIILLVNYVDFGNVNSAGTDSFSPESTKKRIEPVASVNYKDPNTPVVYKSGEEVYKSLCVTCHASGAAGAPKFGNPADWTARLGQGLNGLLHSVINGKGAMQARAGSSPDDYSDYELARAVVYMANASGGNLSEPSAPAPQAKPVATTETNSTAPATPVVAPTATTEAKPAEVAPATNSVEVGKKVFEQACIACHGSGAAGAPKLGDKAAWANRISAGKDALYQSASKGKGAMPPKGGFAGSDEEFKAAIDYMLASIK
jgi:cytochrome c5